MTDTKHGAGPPPAPPTAGDVSPGQQGDGLPAQQPVAGVEGASPRVAPTVIEEEPGAVPPNDQAGSAQLPWLGPGKTQPGEPPLIDPVPPAVPSIVPGHFPIPPGAPMSQPAPQAMSPGPGLAPPADTPAADASLAAVNAPAVMGAPMAAGVDPSVAGPMPGALPAAPASKTPWGLIIAGAVASGLLFGGVVVAVLLLLTGSTSDEAPEQLEAAAESAEVTPEMPASAKPTSTPRPRRKARRRRIPRPRPSSTAPPARPAPAPTTTAAPTASTPTTRRRPPRRRR